jgi:hypothetical protein
MHPLFRQAGIPMHLKIWEITERSSVLWRFRRNLSKRSLLLGLGLALVLFAGPFAVRANEAKRDVPSHVPPKRSSQIHDGFGINSD